MGGGSLATGMMRCHDIVAMLENNYWVKNHYRVKFDAALNIRQITLLRTDDAETQPYIDNLYIGAAPLTGEKSI